jgi:hypothetical protein
VRRENWNCLERDKAKDGGEERSCGKPTDTNTNKGVCIPRYVVLRYFFSKMKTRSKRASVIDKGVEAERFFGAE